MKKSVALIALFSVFIFCGFYYFHARPQENGAPPYQIEDLEPPTDPYAWLKTWTRPEGPARVGLQVGHWKNDELPEELARLTGNTGASGGGKSEWEVNYAIATKTKSLLEEKGIIVDILPSTVPKRYWADVFIAIHADGSTDTSARGFKIAAPRRDYTNKSETLIRYVSESYANATQFIKDPNITKNMTGYYAFAWWRYYHAVHPMATSAILETGFLTNALDRKVIVNKPEVAAKGLSEGIINYLQSEHLLLDKSSLSDS